MVPKLGTGIQLEFCGCTYFKCSSRFGCLSENCCIKLVITDVVLSWRNSDSSICVRNSKIFKMC